MLIGFSRLASYRFTTRMVGQHGNAKKANKKWRIYIDFIDLNKVCPKDSFLLPRIHHLVDAILGHELLNFMDVFSRYNQIKKYP